MQEGPEGVKWELGFAHFLAGKMGFYALGLEFINKKTIENGDGTKVSSIIYQYPKIVKIYGDIWSCNRYWRCDISGAPNGKLHGKTIAMKDNIPVAGIPMMNGSQLLEGYIPDIDASVVSRVLDEGGRILGKAVCENMCFCGGSFTTANGLVKNPLDPSRMSGGSSSGCAVLVSYYNNSQL